jgi:predicted Zn-dependent protease
MKRWIALIALFSAAGLAFYFGSRHKAQSSVGPEAILNVVADTEREISRVPLRLTRLSDEEEVRIGDAMARTYLNRKPTGADEEALTDYIANVGTVIAGRARRKLPYRFHYIADPGLVNAFALPGGHVFVGEGLLQLLDTEDELASVLGHELEHIDNYHCAERVQIQARVRHLPMSDLLQLPAELFMAGYSKDQELEADRDGTALAVMAGYSPSGALHLFEKLEKLHRAYVLKAGNPDQELSKVMIEGIIGYFRSHPLPQEREQQVREMMLENHWPERPERPLRIRPKSFQSMR